MLKVVWSLGPGGVTVRQVFDHLRQQREIAYTTVLTTMQILERKGHLKRKHLYQRALVFEPRHTKEQVLKRIVHDFIERVFDGSHTPLLMHLLGEEEQPVSEPKAANKEELPQ